MKFHLPHLFAAFTVGITANTGHAQEFRQGGGYGLSNVNEADVRLQIAK